MKHKINNVLSENTLLYTLFSFNLVESHSHDLHFSLINKLMFFFKVDSRLGSVSEGELLE